MCDIFLTLFYMGKDFLLACLLVAQSEVHPTGDQEVARTPPGPATFFCGD